MRHIIKDGSLIRGVQVLKMRETSHSGSTHLYEITDKGIEVRLNERIIV